MFFFQNIRFPQRTPKLITFQGFHPRILIIQEKCSQFLFLFSDFKNSFAITKHVFLFVGSRIFEFVDAGFKFQVFQVK